MLAVTHFMSGAVLMIPKISKVLLLALGLMSVAGASPPPPEMKPKPAATPEQAANIAKSQADPARPAKTRDWHDRYDMPWEVDPRQLKFASDRLRDSFLLFDQSARELAKAQQWKMPAPAKYPYLSWNSGSDGYSRAYAGRWESANDEQHTLAIEVEVYDKKRVIQTYEVNVARKPENDWGVSWRLYTSDFASPNRVGYYLSFTHPTLLPPEPKSPNKRQLSLTVGQQVFESGIPQERFSTLRITSSDGHNSSMPNEAAMRDNLPLLWKSAESFRNTVLKDFDVFDANVRQWDVDGGHVARWEGGTSGGDPPRETPYKIQLPEKQRKELVQAALKQSADRRKLIETHYREMYAALLKSFPDFPKLLQYYAPPKESAVP